ncbi:hypothetical protein HU200_038373 [Digitaria exilis]|uniref:Alpha-mannosidase n=1 Tax=Digitaria exilis TaxID=1010633 RepID=A0A835BIM4_9POAL|nr:hypothetical protein HU200_038373 [Digitaria exilis]
MGPVRLALLAAVALAAAAAVGEAVYIPYNTSAGVVPGKLNVHVVPHTHDDVGWLKTVDQYYVGSNNSIQGACVQNVLDSLIPALLKDENRKFIYVEQVNLASRVVITFEMRQSRLSKYLIICQVGFDAFYFFRIDYQDRDTRKGTKELEVVWRGSKSFGSSADIFAGIFPKNYEPPPGDFYFEVDDDSPVVQDDPLLFDYNVEERVNDFVAAALAQVQLDLIMVMFGFLCISLQIYTPQGSDGRINALYSTPSIYTDAKYAANEQWPLKTNDFFPYADNPNGYWTGYFTSRPALKRYVRMMSGYYLAARQLEFFKGKGKPGPTTDYLGDALALAQHHDAVTGTEKQHVANDYAKRLSIGYTRAQELVSTSLSCLTELGSKPRCSTPTTKFSQCLLLNVTYCPPSEMDFSKGRSLVVLVYNSLGWKREDVLRVPVFSDSIVVHDSEGREIESQLLPIASASLNLRDKHVKAYLGTTPGAKPKFWLAFPVSVPPLGFNTYFVSSSKKSGNFTSLSLVHTDLRSATQKYLSNSYTNPASVSLKSTVYSTQGSKDNLQVGQGNLKLQYNSAGTLSLYSDSKALVMILQIRDYRSEWKIEVHQPIAGNYYPVSFLCDSVHLQVNLGIYVEDGSKELSVLVDRSVGGSSIKDGQIELMLHRRLLHDDGRGVAEALNETVCLDNQCEGLTIEGKYYLKIDPQGEGARWRRTFGQEIYSPLLLAFSEQDGGNWVNSHVPKFSAMDPTYSLPDNVALLTLQELEDESVLLRFAHLYEAGEHKDLSALASVDLKQVFPDMKIGKIIETSLSANQERAAMEKKRLKWKVQGPTTDEKVVRGRPVDPSKLVVELGPMEIRTFIVSFDHSISGNQLL